VGFDAFKRKIVVAKRSGSMTVYPFINPSAIPTSSLTCSTLLVSRSRSWLSSSTSMTFSTPFAPAAGSIQMAEAIIKDKKRILPCAAYCDQEYDVGGYFIGVPCMLGANGVEKVIEVELDSHERDLLTNSVEHVKELVGIADGFMNG